MGTLALTYAGLVISDGLVIKALKVSEVAQMARAETRLREYMIAAWNRRQRQAVKRAEAMAKQSKPAARIAAAIDKIMVGWDKEILPAFLAEVERTYKLGREAGWKKATRQTKADLKYPIEERPGVPVQKAKPGVKELARLRPSFDLADGQAIKALKKHQVLWIGNHYKNRVSSSIADTTREVMAQTGQSAAVAGTKMAQKVQSTLSHVKVPGGFMGTAPQYFEGLTANAMTVARVQGQIRSFMDIGIKTYRINNPSDKRTCERCAHMEGKEFKTKQGVGQMQRQLSATSPAQLKKVHPWLSNAQLKAISPTAGPVGGKAGEAQAQAYTDKGQALPPYHFKCRCTVDISTSSQTYENLVPLTPPVPGKLIKPMVPKVPKVPVVPKVPKVPVAPKVPVGSVLNYPKPGKFAKDTSQMGLIDLNKIPMRLQVKRRAAIEVENIKKSIAKAFARLPKTLSSEAKVKATAKAIRDAFRAQTGNIEAITPEFVLKHSTVLNSVSEKEILKSVNKFIDNGVMEVIAGKTAQNVRLIKVPNGEASKLMKGFFSNYSQRSLDAAKVKRLPAVYKAKYVDGGAFYSEKLNAVIIPEKYPSDVASSLESYFKHEMGHYAEKLGHNANATSYWRADAAVSRELFDGPGYKFYKGKWADQYTGSVLPDAGATEVISTFTETLAEGRHYDLVRSFDVNPDHAGHVLAQAKGAFIK